MQQIICKTGCIQSVGGAIDSTAYSFQIGERAPSAWRPYLWPIKLIITISFALMVLQAIAHLIRDIAILRGIDIPMPFTGEVDR